VRGERIKFMIIIIIGNATGLSNALENTIAFSMLKKPIGNLLHVIFFDFFNIYLGN
jgi:hypothetical protein